MFDITLLRTFMAVVEARHFTGAGKKLGLSQSTVSQHVSKLEKAANRKLLVRDTHNVSLTADGNLMAGFARAIIDANQKAVDYFSDRHIQTPIRFGVSEDLVLTKLSHILSDFLSSHPDMGIELSVGLASHLYQKLDSGRLDLILVKRQSDDPRGVVIHRENLIWLAKPGYVVQKDGPVSLVIYSTNSITGRMAVQALDSSGRQWNMSFSSETLSGLRAAVQAGWGVTAQSPILLQHGGLEEVPHDAGLPALGEVEFVVVGRNAHLRGPVAKLAQTVIDRGPDLWKQDS